MQVRPGPPAPFLRLFELILVLKHWQLHISRIYLNRCLRLLTTVRFRLDKFGLAINTVSWEDNARNKNSSWGPCISDMTLQVNGNRLPVIRSPNFQDVTWDVEIEKIPLVIGNEANEMLRTVTLKEYLRNFRDYLHDASPANWAGSAKSLLADRDSHVIMSAQACFLPIPKADDAKFNVCIYNYQSRKDSPAVLAIVASAKGTSAQILDGTHSGQKLFFNQNGKRCSFIGQRLTDNRAERGVATGGAMSQEEKQQNMLLIIQVPLKQKMNHHYQNAFAESAMMDMMAFGAPAMSACAQAPPRSRAVDVEDVIVKVGDEEGPFTEISGVEIERDTSFPVRVTLQYYKATSNGLIDEPIMQGISNQIKEARKFATAIGSLVVGGDTGRVTEHHKHPSVVIPPWWEEFWLMHNTLFGKDMTKDKAQAIVFKNGRFATSTLSEVKDRVLDVLLNSGNESQPSWNVI